MTLVNFSGSKGSIFLCELVRCDAGVTCLQGEETKKNDKKES